RRTGRATATAGTPTHHVVADLARTQRPRRRPALAARTHSNRCPRNAPGFANTELYRPGQLTPRRDAVPKSRMKGCKAGAEACRRAIFVVVIVVPGTGIKPPTYKLRISCSTD